MGKYSKASKKEQCRIRRPRSKIQAASRWGRHSTTNRKNKHNWIGGGEGQRMLANKIAAYNQLLFFVLLFHIRMIVRRNHLNKKQHFQVNCRGSCYCRIYTSMKDYQTLITDRGRPNLMMSLWGTVPFVRHPYEYTIGNTRHVTGRTIGLDSACPTPASITSILVPFNTFHSFCFMTLLQRHKLDKKPPGVRDVPCLLHHQICLQWRSWMIPIQ